MPTECTPKSMVFTRVDGRRVVAHFDGGAITSDAGSLLLGATDQAIGLVDRFADCFVDSRIAERVVHDVRTLLGQRVFGIALGYEDVIDHDELRYDPVLGRGRGHPQSSSGASVRRFPLDNVGQLEPPAAGHRQGGVDAGARRARRQSTLHCHLTVGQDR